MSPFVPGYRPLRCPLGSHRLLSGQATSLRSDRATTLRVLSGRAWVTLGEADAGVPGDSGDRFLEVGEALCVPARTRLVLEPFSEQGDAKPLWFDWVDAPVASRAC